METEAHGPSLEKMMQRVEDLEEKGAGTTRPRRLVSQTGVCPACGCRAETLVLGTQYVEEGVVVPLPGMGDDLAVCHDCYGSGLWTKVEGGLVVRLLVDDSVH